jgi:replicative DNA helicase
MDLNQLPYDSQLEAHIIACMIYDPVCIGEIRDLLDHRYFYHPANALFCQRIFELWDENEKLVDLTSMVPTIEKAGQQTSTIFEAINAVTNTSNIEYHAKRLRDIAALRGAVKTAQELISVASHLRNTDEIRDALVKAESSLSRITESTIITDTVSSLKEAVMEFHEDFERVYYSSDLGVTGLSSGFDDLDKMTAGFQDTDLIIVAARPSVGKTALALQLAENMSVKDKRSGALFSLEMSKKSLVRRMVASTALIDLQGLNTGLISEQDWTKYTVALGILSDGNLIIDDQGGLKIPEIRAKCRRIKRDKGLDYIMIDYLGLIQGERGLSRYELVSETTRQLKNLAKEFKVPVICLCQLSRNLEQRQDKHPIMSDLRESGEIEQTADVIIFLHRDDYYDHQAEKKNIIELIIAKQRNGPVGTVELAYLKNYNRFASLDRTQQNGTYTKKSEDNNKRKWA